MQLHELISVTATAHPDIYIAHVDITDTNGERYLTDYGSTPDDTFGLGPAIREAIDQWINGGLTVNPYVPGIEPVPEEISRWQFYFGLERTGKISKAEALAAMKTGAIPSNIQDIIDSIEDEEAKFQAEMLLIGATNFYRSHPLVSIFAASQEMSDTDVDNFWRLCASL